MGDLAPDVTDIILQEYFRQFYPSVRSAKVRTQQLEGCPVAAPKAAGGKRRCLWQAASARAGSGACSSAWGGQRSAQRRAQRRAQRHLGHPAERRELRLPAIAPSPTPSHSCCLPPAVQVITDAGSGRSKGYGFVRFASEAERDKALTEMNGHFLSNRPIRVSLATAKKNANTTTASAVQAPHPSDFDPTNTTLFIGGLSPSVSEDALRAVFSRFGDIIYVKIPQGKGCGFVQFVLRTAAEQAMAAMNGQVRGAQGGGCGTGGTKCCLL